MPQNGPRRRETWTAFERQLREVFARWADYRLRVFDETPAGLRDSDGRFERMVSLISAIGSAEEMAAAWSSTLDPTSSIQKAQYLAGVLRTGEPLTRYVSRVAGLMNDEIGLLPSIRTSYEASYQSSQRRALLFRRYERYLPDFNIPVKIDLMVESALYALYVAWSPSSKLILPDNRSALWRALAVDEEALRVVTPRRFEELVAYLYEQLGCRTVLTGASRDGGADILAWHPGPFGTESLIAIQTKFYSKERKVDLAGVHALHGAVAHYNAKHGHLVATSDVTEPARKFLTDQDYHFVDLAALRREVETLLG